MKQNNIEQCSVYAHDVSLGKTNSRHGETVTMRKIQYTSDNQR